MMSWGHRTGAGFGWVIAGLGLVLVLALVVGLVVYLVARSGGAGAPGRAVMPPVPPGPPAPPTAVQILAERYARGEISTEEYQERLRHLSP